MIIKEQPLSLRKPNPKGGFNACDMSNVAYVRPITISGRVYHSIHAADGTPLSITAQRDNAFALVRQNKMKPTSVH